MSTFSKIENAVAAKAESMTVAQAAVAYAEQHAADTGEPEMAIGDLEIMLAKAISLIPGPDRVRWVAEVKEELGIDES